MQQETVSKLGEYIKLCQPIIEPLQTQRIYHVPLSREFPSVELFLIQRLKCPSPNPTKVHYTHFLLPVHSHIYPQHIFGKIIKI